MRDIIFDPQMTSYDMASLESLVEEIKPTHALEVGSWKGLSSSIIARYSSVLYCVDTWKGAPEETDMVSEAKERSVLQVFLNNMHALGVADRIKPMVMTSHEARILFREGHLDFVYIDGDHSYEQVMIDLSWFDLLKPGAIMAGHDNDVHHPGVQKALEETFGNAYKAMEKSSVWFIQKGVPQ